MSVRPETTGRSARAGISFGHLGGRLIGNIRGGIDSRVEDAFRHGPDFVPVLPHPGVDPAREDAEFLLLVRNLGADDRLCRRPGGVEFGFRCHSVLRKVVRSGSAGAGGPLSSSTGGVGIVGSAIALSILALMVSIAAGEVGSRPSCLI